MLPPANVLRHIAAQIGTGLLFAGATYLAGADYSALGPYAVMAQGIAATLVAVLHQVFGTAPATSQ